MKAPSEKHRPCRRTSEDHPGARWHGRCFSEGAFISREALVNSNTAGEQFSSSSAGSLSTYLSEISRYALLSVKEERGLARRYKTGDFEAGHHLVTSNLRFVVKVAYEYRSYGIRMADLIQEGNIGLMKAVRKFDPNKQIRLISYAVWWIRAYIQN